MSLKSDTGKPANRGGPLTRKQQAFVREYPIDNNGTQAAIRAGFSPRTANEQAARLLAKVNIRAEIDKILAKLAAKVEVTAERVLREIALLAFANMEDYVRQEGGDIVPDLSKCTRDQMAAVQEFTVDRTGGTGDGERKLVLRTKFKLADKGANLEHLGKYLKLFIDKVEVSGSLKSLSDEEIQRKVTELMTKAKS